MYTFNIQSKDPVNIPGNPFDLGNNQAYQAWREWKLADYPSAVSALIVPVADASQLTAQEHTDLLACCAKTNLAIYRISNEKPAEKSEIRRLGEQFGLRRLDDNLCADEDSITSLQVVEGGRHATYIPYTNRPLSWHTDGYYNEDDRCIRAIVMHCVHAAAEGGENAFYDHELAYIQLRDENPLFIKALMANDAMTIPPNVENGVQIRGACSGPVFSLENGTGSLHMRFSARQRNIIWKDEALTRDAVALLNRLLAEETFGLFRYRLQAGEGIISNNVLHRREAFNDAPEQDRVRLLYRARYYDRVQGTELDTLRAGRAQ